MDTGSIAGEYYLKGVHEMASGFLLKPDNTFEFFFSYGALDRYGRGHWTLLDNKITFNSRPWPGYDFSLSSHRKIQEDAVLIKVETGNPVIARYCFCALNNTSPENWKELNQQGEATFSATGVTTIHLACEFVSERQTAIEVPGTGANEFTFKTEDWLFEYFFKDISLRLCDDGLIGAHPLLKGTEWVYGR